MIVKEKRKLIKEEIISSAREVFRKYGYRKTTMDDIAALMNRGKTSLYYYYKSKEELFQAVVDCEAARLKNKILSSLENEKSVIGKFKKYIYSRMMGLKDLSLFYEAIHMELYDHLKYINQAREKFDKDELIMIKEIIKEGVKNKELAECDENKSANAILSILKGLEMQLFVDEIDDNELTENLNDIINIIIHGIIKCETQ
ncbi:MAG: TetR/AcrR family transcriptional regulator [Marinilabiliales bacterium]